MSEINDGGHAFPGQPAYGTPPAGVTVMYGQRGMSLRDWFAGQALVGMGTWSPWDPMDQDQRARWAYQQADAMLKAREVRP